MQLFNILFTTGFVVNIGVIWGGGGNIYLKMCSCVQNKWGGQNITTNSLYNTSYKIFLMQTHHINPNDSSSKQCFSFKITFILNFFYFQKHLYSLPFCHWAVIKTAGLKKVALSCHLLVNSSYPGCVGVCLPPWTTSPEITSTNRQGQTWIRLKKRS